MHAAIFIDIHTLLCSNLFALSDTPNIVTPDTTLIGPGFFFFCGPVAQCATQKHGDKEEPCHNAALEAKVKLSIKGRERKGRQTFGN